VFVPGAGVAEDPATGSAVAPIALHVHSHATNQIGRSLSITQGLEIGRPSELLAEFVYAGNQLSRIHVGGECVLLGRGEWQIPGRVTE
jgi:trans-2,3-dihydro-3-hydroxyanthranilate isomerase